MAFASGQVWCNRQKGCTKYGRSIMLTNPVGDQWGCVVRGGDGRVSYRRVSEAELTRNWSMTMCEHRVRLRRAFCRACGKGVRR